MKEESTKLKPIIKWVGGERQLLPIILPIIKRQNFRQYVEPFAGGASVLLNLKPVNAILADKNPELINLYRVTKNDYKNLKKILKNHILNHNEAYFKYIRSLDYSSLSPVCRAARTLYLNRSCFNGLYRLNSKGQFNSPSGKRTKIDYNLFNLRNVSDS